MYKKKKMDSESIVMACNMNINLECGLEFEKDWARLVLSITACTIYMKI